MRSPLVELVVVSHTHWDREWYHTADRFRQRLVALIDDLLDDPPGAGESFLLDGQAVLVEDYLAVRPERAAEVSTLLRDNRLEAGPWYVLADELIPSGEALVRNLLAGREMITRLRGESPKVLYCPDSFGHPASLPDIAAGFGCDVVVLWRGFGGARWPSVDTVRWRGVSGAHVVLHHLPPDGYEFGSSLPVERHAATARWQRIADAMADRSATGTALLMNGADHHGRQRQARLAIEMLTSAAAPVRVRATTLHDAAFAMHAAARDRALPEIAGELRDSYGYTWTLQGTLGTRAAQKRRNARAERSLVRDVEPWIALADADVGQSRRALLQAAWRELLRAHPHDTLCGTSIDGVARAFDSRLSSVEDQRDGLRESALEALVEHDRERARLDSTRWEPVVVIRNTAARPRRGVAELTLRAKRSDVAVGPGSASRQGRRLAAPPLVVHDTPLQVLSRAERVELTESPRAYPDADVVVEAQALGWIDAIEGYTVQSRLQRGSAAVVIPNPVSATARTLDNGLVHVEVSDEGVISFEDRTVGQRIDDVLGFERRRDIGDLYTPAVREALDTPHVRRVRLIHRGPLRGEFAIHHDYGRGAHRSTLAVTLQLHADSPLLHVFVSGRNHAVDQRLRLMFRTALPSSRTVADAAFAVLEREAIVISDSDAAMEQVTPTAPLHRWVTRFGSASGATVISDGLAEYESTGDGAVMITLVRSVGALSRPDLPERPGHAGWPCPVPEAQCLGPFEARFALSLHGPDSPDVREEIERHAEDALLPLSGESLRSNLQPPQTRGGLQLRGVGLAFSTAMPAQRDGWIVLRCVNRRDTTTTGEWRVGRPLAEAMRARLDETPLHSLSVAEGVISFEASPHEVVTILAR